MPGKINIFRIKLRSGVNEGGREQNVRDMRMWHHGNQGHINYQHGRQNHECQIQQRNPLIKGFKRYTAFGK